MCRSSYSSGCKKISWCPYECPCACSSWLFVWISYCSREWCMSKVSHWCECVNGQRNCAISWILCHTVGGCNEAIWWLSWLLAGICIHKWYTLLSLEHASWCQLYVSQSLFQAWQKFLPFRTLQLELTSHYCWGFPRSRNQISL